MGLFLWRDVYKRQDMEAGVKFAHENGVKVYVTANIVAHNEDLEGIREYFRELKEIGPDALIISEDVYKRQILTIQKNMKI